MEKPHLIVIGGPTASGKSALAVKLCQAICSEVVSSDSMQIYQGMPIGTAQPDEEERQGIKHHLIGVVSPKHSFTAAMYKESAEPIVKELLADGKCPVICGGTGLYIDALTKPISMASPSDENLRDNLRRQAEEEGGKTRLFDRLKQVDSQTAARLHENDVRRVIRALEIFELTGRTMTEQNQEDSTREGDYSVSMYALLWPRELLYERINRRVDSMMERGLVDEVRELLECDVPRNATSMQALGYKEIVEALDGRISMNDAVQKIKLGSRHYAKRQETWFKRDGRCIWLDAERKGLDELTEEILKFEKARGFEYE